MVESQYFSSLRENSFGIWYTKFALFWISLELYLLIKLYHLANCYSLVQFVGMVFAAQVWYSFCSKAKTYVCVASACVWHRLCNEIGLTNPKLVKEWFGMVFADKAKTIRICEWHESCNGILSGKQVRQTILVGSPHFWSSQPSPTSSGFLCRESLSLFPSTVPDSLVKDRCFLTTQTPRGE